MCLTDEYTLKIILTKEFGEIDGYLVLYMNGQPLRTPQVLLVPGRNYSLKGDVDVKREEFGDASMSWHCNPEQGERMLAFENPVRIEPTYLPEPERSRRTRELCLDQRGYFPEEQIGLYDCP